ncbi:MAG: glutaredoxin [Lachnospiraceae bacterium]|nr:glutaredoxin [Lachnospiraceae bacterium]
MTLDLYMMETCPFCKRVIREIEAQGRTDIKLRDITKSEEDRETLNRVGGKEQVPCLFIDGQPLYESMDIINWMKSNPQAG